MTRTTTRRKAWAQGACTSLAFGAAAAALAVMPQVLSPYLLILLCHALVFALACLGLNLVFGLGGLLSLGHAPYFGIGAYAGAFLYRFWELESLELYLLAGFLSATALAAAFGFLCTRATRIHFAILTLALGQMVHALFISGAAFEPFGGLGRGLYLLGGGGMYIPRFTILGTQHPPQAFIPVLYHVIVVVFLGVTALLWRVHRSPFANALRSIRDNETRAKFIGLPVRRYRWYAFILSGMVMGLAGGLYGQLSRQITPEQLHWLFSANLVLATILGGTRDFLGPVLGAFLFMALDELSSWWTLGRRALMGVMLIAVVFAFPRGLAGGLTALWERRHRLAGRAGGTAQRG